MALPLRQRLLGTARLKQGKSAFELMRWKVGVTMFGPTFSLCMLTNSRMILSFSASCRLLRRISFNNAFQNKQSKSQAIAKQEMTEYFERNILSILNPTPRTFRTQSTSAIR